ncbi:hypothetical protein PROFUN_09413 [Planoprotostelium fungivorum]|uniref:PHD-type domain-containing protein n=1 Tax=Planoprotostelium fungivorum TaxID=1890364 RepID=A0A2P6NHF1_9EUKA|nr:hypothetical protein PROFUN_09413 [Planoprotostelium fungivorum]
MPLQRPVILTGVNLKLFEAKAQDAAKRIEGSSTSRRVLVAEENLTSSSYSKLKERDRERRWKLSTRAPTGSRNILNLLYQGPPKELTQEHVDKRDQDTQEKDSKQTLRDRLLQRIGKKNLTTEDKEKEKSPEEIEKMKREAAPEANENKMPDEDGDPAFESSAEEPSEEKNETYNNVIAASPMGEEKLDDSALKKRKVNHVEGTIVSINNNNYIMPHYNSQRPGSNAIFGPQVVKKALRILNSRATAVEITEWIANHRPEYVTYFGDRKKLRYSIVGILSARAYKNTFVKEVVMDKGVKRADWILMENDNDGIIETDGPALVEDTSVRVCNVCKGTTREGMAVCMSCELACHWKCLDPPVHDPPSASWICNDCAQKDWVKTPISTPKPKPTPKVKKLKPLDEEYNDEEKSQRKPVRRNIRRFEAEEEDDKLSNSSRRSKRKKSEDRPDIGSLMDMATEAVQEMGGSATTAEILTWMEEQYGHDLNLKDKMWRAVVTTNLANYFLRAGRGHWKAPGNHVSDSDEGDTDDDEREKIESKTRERSTSLSLSGADVVKPLVVPPPAPFQSDETTRTDNAAVQKGPNLRPPSLRKPNNSIKLFEPDHLAELIQANATTLPEYRGIVYINKTYPVLPGPSMNHPGHIMSMNLSRDGNLLGTVSDLGTLRVWKLQRGTDTWTLVKEYVEPSEAEEYHFVHFSRDNGVALVGGKRKDKKRWNGEMEDYESIAGQIKVYDIETGKIVHRLEGHPSDINVIEEVQFNGSTFLLSGGHQSSILKWDVGANLRQSRGHVRIAEQGTSTVHSISVVPGTGSKFFLASCDDSMKLFDFETEQVVQSFPTLYSYICDVCTFVFPMEIPSQPNEMFLLTKGVELVNDKDEPSVPNAVHLRKLIFPTNGRGKVGFELVKTFQHKEYLSNSWFMRCASNGRYVLSPNTDGKIFVWNMQTQSVVAILRDSGKDAIRKIIFHPSSKCILACSDDSKIYVYQQEEPKPKTSETSPLPGSQAEGEGSMNSGGESDAGPSVDKEKTTSVTEEKKEEATKEPARKDE